MQTQQRPTEYIQYKLHDPDYFLNPSKYSGKGYVSQIIPEDLHARHPLR
jgi:hypothetical protein